MRLALLKSTHSSYDSDTWVKYESLYRGGKDFRANIGMFLHRNPLEAEDTFRQRKAESAYRSYVGPIVDYFSSQLMAAPLTVRCNNADGSDVESLDQFYSEFKEDADGSGTDLVDLARDAFRTALIKGSAWLLVSMPQSPDRVATLADWRARGLGRARVELIQPNNVLDWERGEDGELDWVLTYSESTPRAKLSDDRGKLLSTWRYYDRTSVETFERRWDPRVDRSDPEQDVPSIGKIDHGFSRVPLVQLNLPRGLWLLNRVAEAQIEHFRLSAGLTWAIRRTCYAMPVFKMTGGNAGEGPVMGSGQFLVIGTDDDVTWLSPPSAPFQVIADEAKSQKDEIYRVANQMANGVDNNAAAVGRSAQSKHADSASTEVCLLAYGAVVREALEKIYDTVSDGRGDQVRWRIGGLDRFNLNDPLSVVESAVKAQDLNVPSATFKKELLIHTADALMPSLTQDKKDAIRSEISMGIDGQS